MNDGANTYSYNHANRLVTASGPGYTSSYVYNGLGDRLQQTVNSVTTSYTLDLEAGLTQVLADGANTYLYGNGRIAQYGASGEEYFLGDALGSVRQLADISGEATLARAYEPYGEVFSAEGFGNTSYGFTGEWRDAGIGLIYLRARWLSTQTGRFLTQDTWGGNARQPMSYNAWLYGYANPVNQTDSSGYCPDDDGDGKCANTNPYKAVCSRLTGNDYLACEKIIRGINPDISLPIGLIKALGGLRNCRELANLFSPPRLPQDYQTDTTQYGYWFHWLAENVPGWWNENGNVDVSIQQLIAIAYGRETSSMISVQRYREAVTEAFARKTWAAGFYYYIGSRQAVQTIVEYGIFGMDCKGWCAKNYSPTKFVEQLSGYDFGPDGEAFEQAGRILTRGDWRTRMDNKPWEFGNPTDNSPETFKKALHQGNIGDGPSQVYYFNIPWEQRSRAWSDTENNWVYNIAIVVTPVQVSNLCNNASCLGR